MERRSIIAVSKNSSNVVEVPTFWHMLLSAYHRSGMYSLDAMCSLTLILKSKYVILSTDLLLDQPIPTVVKLWKLITVTGTALFWIWTQISNRSFPPPPPNHPYLKAWSTALPLSFLIRTIIYSIKGCVRDWRNQLVYCVQQCKKLHLKGDQFQTYFWN